MTMKKVRVEDAVGMVLGHDMTKIVPGEYKGPAFKKGHIIQPEDIPHLKNIGKEHIYLIELAAGQVHENDAVRRMGRAVAGENILCAEPAEGRVTLSAGVDGLLKVNRQAVNEINCVDHAVLATRHDNQLVRAGDMLAGIKVVPLVVNESTVSAVEQIGSRQQNLITVRPLQKMKVGVIVTGNEVFYGRIKDRFAPVFAGKIAEYGAIAAGTVFQPDEREKITQAIFDYQEQGVDVIIATGGMSVDPDDVTPDAIRASGAEIVTYGSPVLPGAMFMLAYLGNVAVMGIPACGMYSKITVFDLVFPRILAGERITRSEISAMGYGGLCLNCPECSYPHCPFGK
ncbi:MAG TPA: molybdopterin-binding protein [Patescibacteria group bacterium]|nr:molybdopterin-binding protein [Patescibacteria group bacterium]